MLRPLRSPSILCSLASLLDRRSAAASPLSAESPRVTRLLCDSVAAAPPGPPRAALAASLQLLFRGFARAAHCLYEAVSVDVPAGWSAAVADTIALRRALDAIFLAPVLFYSTARPAECAAASAGGQSGGLSPAGSAAVALDTLAFLEFARMPFDAYAPLLESSVALLSRDCAACAGARAGRPPAAGRAPSLVSSWYFARS